MERITSSCFGYCCIEHVIAECHSFCDKIGMHSVHAVSLIDPQTQFFDKFVTLVIFRLTFGYLLLV